MKKPSLHPRKPAVDPVRAGAAFLTAIESDPTTKAAWERTRAMLQTFNKAMKEAMNSPEYREALETDRRKWQDLADALREKMETAGDTLEAQDLPRPTTIEDWIHLARIAEIPFEKIQKGTLTAGEIHECALAWADKQKIKMKIKAKIEAEQGTNAPRKTPPPPALTKEVKRAALLYQQAIGQDEALNTDRKVWIWLRENLEPEERPTFESFRKNLSRAREHGILPRKHAPRNTNRVNGKSVIREDQR